MTDANTLILDTHIWVWLAEGDPELSQKTIKEIDRVAQVGEILVSAISVWEIGMLEMRGRLSLSKPIWQWVSEALSQSSMRLVPVSAEIALASCFLPGEFHQDPADRFIVASAQIENAAIVTRDRRIVDYGKKGYARVLKS